MPRKRAAHPPACNSRVLLTRRSVLQGAGWGAGWMLAAAAVPWIAVKAAQDAAAQTVSPAMARLSAYMSEARERELPSEALEKCKHHILDTFSAMVSGAELLPGRQAIHFARAYGGEKVSTVVASNIRCGPIEAAIANAELAHSDETDDYDPRSGGHPGCSIVPAALALGEQFGISGQHFLRAVMLGYDVGLRATSTVVLGTMVKDIHNTLGTFGAAAAGGCAASLNSQQMRWLLDYAAQQSAAGITVWKRDTDHIEKAFIFAGSGARNGVTAALLVQSGWTGVNDILSGAGNFLETYAPKADPASLTDKLGERYEMAFVNIKKWSVGGPIQPALDALENLFQRRSFQPDQVRQVIVRVATEGAGTVNNREMPDICLQHLIAVMLIDKSVSFHAAHDKARMEDPAVLRQRSKVQLVPSEEFQRLNPKRVALVEVTLIDGTLLSERVEAVRGTVENPMTRDEVISKARDLMAPVLGAEVAVHLISKVIGLENVKDIRELRPFLSIAI